MPKDNPATILTLGVPGVDPLEASIEREAWSDEVRRLEGMIERLLHRGIKDNRVEDYQVQMEKAALELEAWDFKRALDDPDGFANATLQRRFEDAKSKVEEFMKKKSEGTVSGSDKSSSVPGS